MAGIVSILRTEPMHILANQERCDLDAFAIGANELNAFTKVYIGNTVWSFFHLCTPVYSIIEI